LTALSTGITFRKDIQGLRAVAVGLVVLAHAGVAGFSGGFVGVDVFFVLSGYLITGLLVDERLSTGTICYGRFLSRRLKRLLPAMLVMLVLVLSVSSLALTAFEMRVQSRSFPFATVWASNFYFAFVERDYFQALQAEDLFLHTWSLGVEEQFYIVWPWLILLFVGLRIRDNTCHARANVVIGALATIFAASLALSLYLSAYMPILSFYMMPTRAWQFALGSAVFIGLHLRDTVSDEYLATEGGKTAFRLVGGAGLLLILGSSMLLSSNTNYPGYYALFPSFGAAMIIAAGKLYPTLGVSGLLRQRIFVWLGDRSYSIYLWHWPVLKLGSSMGVAKSIPGVVTLIIVSFLLSMASYRYVELPFWKGGRSRAVPSTVLLHSALAIVLSIGLSTALERSVYGETAVPPKAVAYEARADIPKILYSGKLDCDTWVRSSELVPCAVADGDGGHRAVLLGDSIGAQWSNLVADMLAEQNWKVTVLTKSACAIVDHTWYYGIAGGDFDVCTEWRRNALGFIADARPDVVFVGSSAFYEFTEAQWVDGSRAVNAELSAAAGQVIVIPGIPRLSFDGPSCLGNPMRYAFQLIDGERECEESRQETVPDDVSNYLLRSAHGFNNVQVLDLGDLVCPNRRCAASTADGIPVFRDSTHLTVAFVESLVPEVRDRLRSMGFEAGPD